MMKFFWSFIARIYSELCYSGINLSIPKRLFHHPIKKLNCEYQCVIFADTTFNESERLLILEALDNLHQFCNGLIQLDIVFTLDPNDKDQIKNNCVLIRADEEHPSIVKADGYHDTRVLGLCEYMNNDTIRLYLVPERLKHPITFRTTMIHELGHFIGLDHTARHSIMHKSNYSNVLYPTYVDAQEMAKVWNTESTYFRYFKL